MRFLFCLAICLLATGSALAAEVSSPVVSPDHAAFFEQHIRPLLSKRCYECHSGEAKILKGSLYLDHRAGWMKGGDSGEAVIIPGRPDESLLIKGVSYADPDFQMPPKGKLPEEEIALLREWVKLGAPDPRNEAVAPAAKGIDVEAGRQWWAFQPLKHATPPVVKNKSHVRTPVDAFILAKLEERGIAPNPGADRRTLIRRVYFDLIGLPPPPEVVDRFVADKPPDAYARLIDELLTSPHFGERWGRHWLDVARFAESYGFEHDYDRPHAYHYRDFVIKAFNADMPYDQFVKWQLAGDEYLPGEPLAMMATGFLGAGVFPTQITQKEVEKSRYDDMDNMLATTGTAMLGLTIGCARCHDHKFDPIPVGDYYNMLATFTTTVRSEVEINLDPAGYEKAKEQYEREHAPLLAARDAYETEQLPSVMNQWLSDRGKTNAATVATRAGQWVVVDATKHESRGKATFTKQPDGSLLVGGANPDHDTFTITAETKLDRVTAVRLEALAHESLVRGGPGRASNGNFGLSDFNVTAEPANGQGKPVEVKLVRPRSTFDQANLGVANAIDNDKTSCWAVDPRFGKDHAAVFEFAEPIGFEGGTVLKFQLVFTNNTQHGIGRPRISVSGSAAPDRLPLQGDQITQKAAEVLAMLDADADAKLSEEQRAELFAWFRTTDPQWRELNEAVEQHALKAAAKPSVVTVQVCSEGVKPMRKHSQGADFFETTYHLKRGDPNSKDGEAMPSFLQVLMRHPDGAAYWQKLAGAPPEGSKLSHRRRAMAEWMTDVEHGAGHLLARVIVNRLWQHHMGRGIVATPGDFGVQGSPPTHPELLDWLAAELIAHDWKLSHVHRLILHSATYQQSADVSADKLAADPDNALWWRWPRRRLEGEVIRDAMLAASGELDTTPFGPGTLDETMNRRSIYFFIKRSRLISMMLLFDAPDALQSISSRSTTTVAPQALLMMNNDVVRDVATAMAKRVRPHEATPLKQAIVEAYRLALSRGPTELEAVQAMHFIEAQARTYEPTGRADPMGVALADFCQALLASNEFVYIE